MFFETLRISLSSIYMNKLRSSLTALGIIIGVLSVTVMGTLISGLDRSFENSMSWLGKDILYISRWELCHCCFSRYAKRRIFVSW